MSRSGDDGTPVWHLKGELDLATAGEVKEAFDDWLHTARLVPTLTLDLEGLTFIDSAGVRAIFELTMAPGCLQVVLVDPGDVVRRVFEIVGLDRHPKIQLVNR
ncbi:MAG TPA: STAS domain-containing protein [Actinomycetota bacterium]|nr:STAS domain-containing protein [Actinomycetota bacterium]